MTESIYYSFSVTLVRITRVLKVKRRGYVARSIDSVTTTVTVRMR